MQAALSGRTVCAGTTRRIDLSFLGPWAPKRGNEPQPREGGPHLLYSQAIKGRFTGLGIGIIDTIHLVEVVRAASVSAVAEGEGGSGAVRVARADASQCSWGLRLRARSSDARYGETSP